MGLALAGAAPARAQVAAQASPMTRPQGAPLTGAQIYRAACANCHGVDGRGSSFSVVGFREPVVPDLADCRATTPETNRQWSAVDHKGGPARGFSARMPAFGSALSDDEIRRVIEYIRGFCGDRRWPRGELNLPRPFFTEKAYPENEVVLDGAYVHRRPRALDQTLFYERRIGTLGQIELLVPFGAHERTNDLGAPARRWTGVRLGDVAVAYKRVLFHSLRGGTILSAAGEAAFPTGDTREGFGVGTTVVEPAVLFGQLLPWDAFLQAQGAVGLSMNRSKAPHEAVWRAVLGKTWIPVRFGREWSPMVEVQGVRELVEGGVTEWDIVPQLQVTLSRRQHVRGLLGYRVPVERGTERSREFLAYVLWDWFDGGLFQGW
ncbi:MAG: cytochrome c [Gemmatimonadetes bacterium]|nr:cytochrome c [Gemmatimonadota bacterium]